MTTGALSTNQIAYATTTYGNNGEVLAVLDAANTLTTFVHDGYDRLTQAQFPLGASQPVYDADDLLNRVLMVSNVSASGPGITYAYDALGR